MNDGVGMGDVMILRKGVVIGGTRKREKRL